MGHLVQRHRGRLSGQAVETMGDSWEIIIYIYVIIIVMFIDLSQNKGMNPQAMTILTRKMMISHHNVGALRALPNLLEKPISEDPTVESKDTN